MAVVQHGSVHHSFVIFGKMLQILVVSGNHAERTFQVEAFQYGFGNGTANLWLRTSSELIDKDELSPLHDFSIIFMLVRCEDRYSGRLQYFAHHQYQ